MNTNLIEKIQKSVSQVLLSKNKISFNGYKDVSSYIKTRKKIELLPEQKDLIIKHLKANSIDKLIQYKKTDTPYEYEYSDPYGEAEYFTSLDAFLFSNDVSRRLRTNFTKPLSIYAYGLEAYANKDKLFPKVKFKKSDIPTLNLKKRNSIVLSKIYNEKKLITLDDTTKILLVNMPYEYYSKIYTHDNFYNFDVDTKELIFTGDNQAALENLVNNIADNGIQDPLPMKIEKGHIVSTNDAYGRLLAALILGLETIPVALYVITEIINPLESMIPDDGLKEQSNILCEPYFYFL